VTDIVRTCEKTYSEETIIKQGIRIHEMKFDDGKFPSKEIIKNFLNIVYEAFQSKGNENESESKCIAVHCIAGLGR
jgi:protein tyrosine phosphatase type 4A